MTEPDKEQEMAPVEEQETMPDKEPESAQDKEQQKAFVKEMMEANGLEGATKKRLIKYLGQKYDWDKEQVQFKLKRALITERYAAVAEH